MTNCFVAGPDDDDVLMMVMLMMMMMIEGLGCGGWWEGEGAVRVRWGRGGGGLMIERAPPQIINHSFFSHFRLASSPVGICDIRQMRSRLSENFFPPLLPSPFVSCSYSFSLSHSISSFLHSLHPLLSACAGYTTLSIPCRESFGPSGAMLIRLSY